MLVRFLCFVVPVALPTGSIPVCENRPRRRVDTSAAHNEKPWVEHEKRDDTKRRTSCAFRFYNLLLYIAIVHSLRAHSMSTPAPIPLRAQPGAALFSVSLISTGTFILLPGPILIPPKPHSIRHRTLTSHSACNPIPTANGHLIASRKRPRDYSRPESSY